MPHRYLEKGWPVFPIAARGKEPLTPRGFHDATLDKDQVAAWMEVFPGCNWGVATGAAGLCVLDVDPKNRGFASMQQLVDQHGYLPDTPTVKTGSGGWHYYFQSDGTLRNKARLGGYDGIDIRAMGGYVVVPPSIHPNGKEYAWQGGTFALAPAPLPAWLLEMCKDKPPVLSGSADGENVMEGGRNDYLTRLGGALRRKGLGEAALYQALMAENEEKCNPPLPEREVSRITFNLLRYIPGDPVAAQVNAEQAAKPKQDALVISGGDLVAATLEYLDDKNIVKGMPTGIEGLDTLLGGGKRTREITVTHAEAKTGKNTLWHKMMHGWLVNDLPVAYASREISPEREVLPNLLSLHFKENAWLEKLSEERRIKYTEVLKRWPIYFARGAGYFDLDEIARWIAELRKMGVRFFWFDHLHWMLSDPGDFKEAIKLMQFFKRTAMDEDVHIDLIIQPNQLQEGQRLSLNSMKGGSAMGQTLDNLLIMERVRGEGVPKNLSRLTLQVGRSKLCKQGESIQLLYDPATTDFTEVEEVDLPPPSMAAPLPPSALPRPNGWNGSGQRIGEDN